VNGLFRAFRCLSNPKEKKREGLPGNPKKASAKKSKGARIFPRPQTAGQSSTESMGVTKDAKFKREERTWGYKVFWGGAVFMCKYRFILFRDFMCRKRSGGSIKKGGIRTGLCKRSQAPIIKEDITVVCEGKFGLDFPYKMA